jgi:hypothetical protein
MLIDEKNSMWRKIVTGAIDPPIRSLPLKIKVNFLRMQVKTNKITADSAIKELLEFCQSNEKVFEADLNLIVKSNVFQK